MLQSIILIGGKSQRMGSEKYQLEINGKPQYIHLFEMMADLKIPTYLSCNQQQFDHLPAGFPAITDKYPDIGPMGGLAAAIDHDHQHSILLIACDLIHITTAVIQNLINENDAAYEVITYQKKATSFHETTITIYNPGSFNHVKSAIESQEYSLQQVLKQCKVKTIFLDDEQLLKNANLKSDLD